METLEKYLTEDFPVDDRDIKEIENLLELVSLVYVKEFDPTTAWPYEVRQPSTPNQVQGQLSQSTTAMILGALLRYCDLCNTVDQTQRGNVSKANIPPIESNDTQKSLAQNIRSASDLLLNAIAPGGDTITTKSGTFGQNDVFTLAWLAEIADAKWEIVAGAKAKEKWSAVSDLVLTDAISKFKKWEELKSTSGLFVPPFGYSLPHVFPVLRLVQAIRRIQGRGFLAQPNAYRYFERFLHEQLSYSSIPDSRFDPAELTFCLEGMLLCQRNVVDRSLFDRVLAVLTIAQSENPYWRPVKPYLATAQGLVLFPVSIEVANSLLRACAIFDENELHDTYGSKSITLFRRYWQWLKARNVRLPQGSDELVGWHSEHVNQPTVIHLWETSQVIEFLLAYRNALHSHIARVTLVRSRFEQMDFDQEDWAKIERENEPVTNLGSDLRVYNRIGEDFIAPHLSESADRNYSMLLYGPPGTGKTTIAKNIAKGLGRRLITITVSDFLAEGGAQIEARAKNIFAVLNSQRPCVVLFDEIDHFLLDRDSILYTEQDTIFQFMTPGMLTKLNNLRWSKRALFIVATNYEDRIDAAIKRTGRIDRKFLVLPPDKNRRRETLEKQIAGRLELPETISPSQWTKLEESSLFLGPKDIIDCVTSVRRQSKPTVDLLVGALRDRARATSLEAYGSRFQRINAQGEPIMLEASKTPLGEFLCLLALRTEINSEMTNQEKAVIKTASKVFKSDNRDITADSIKNYAPELNKEVADKVAEFLLHTGTLT